MAKLLLTSCGFFTDSIKEEFLNLLHPNMNTKAGIITTASPKKEKNPFALKAKMDF